MDMYDLGDGFESLIEGVAQIKCPTLVSVNTKIIIINSYYNILLLLFKVLGVTSDILFPVTQQREMVELLQKSGIQSCTHTATRYCAHLLKPV